MSYKLGIIQKTSNQHVVKDITWYLRRQERQQSYHISLNFSKIGFKYVSGLVNRENKLSHWGKKKEKKRKKVVHVCVVKNVKNFSSERTEKIENLHSTVKLLSLRKNFQLQLHLN